MINVKIVMDDFEVEFLAECVEVSDATGDDSLRLKVIDTNTIKLDTAPL